jgi:pimeloyl-ACP methyl ester carboxylesterase
MRAMKKIAFLSLIVLIPLITQGQDITGSWNGVLKIQGMELRVVFNISKTDSGYKSTMDSPDQGALGIPVTSTTVEGRKLDLKVDNAKIHYQGEFQDSIIAGTFTQGALSLPMNLRREAAEKTKLNRPQEPVKPYPYYEEEVTFENSNASIKLAGTLTMPSKEGLFPAVVLISGSGPQNRDEEVFGHKPFLVLADYLTRNGVAVLRYDDRGTAMSEGDFQSATSVDNASDAEAAIAYLKSRKEINKEKIGLIGHSEGGIIAPMVAVATSDVKFIVLLAGTGIPGNELLELQQELIGRASGMSESDLKTESEVNKGVFDIIVKSTDTALLRKELTEYIRQKIKEHPDVEIPEGTSDEEFIKNQVAQVTNPWIIFFLKYDPAPTLEKVKCPVLALNGEKDLQVPPKENLSAIEAALKKGKNNNVTIKELPGLNHLFQECKTGAPDEYVKIEQTMSPTALEEINRWMIKNHFK